MGILLDIANGAVVIEKGKVVIAKEVQSASDGKVVTKVGTAI